MKNLLAMFLLLITLVSFMNCAGLTNAVKVVDEKTDIILAQWDTAKDLYIAIKDQVIAKKNAGELNISPDLWKKMVDMDAQLKNMDALMQEIKLVKVVSKEQAAKIKAATEGMSKLVKLALKVI